MPVSWTVAPATGLNAVAASWVTTVPPNALRGRVSTTWVAISWLLPTVMSDEDAVSCTAEVAPGGTVVQEMSNR
ncbi:hypothetical protein GALL_444650 [mine drainage metagenome]|uniref:Uncharacterized protein n=1 Tax=mine drainage metagenome TaxID=410659 RepID=A0A1J5PQW3_9ZZZZ